jgi:hypothetical protein
MATSKSKTAKKTTHARAAKGPHKAAKKASPAKVSKKTAADDVEDDEEEEELEFLEVKKPGARKAGKKYAKLDLKPIKVPTRTVGSGKKARKVKPKKLSAAMVLSHLTEETGLARKDVRLVIETLATAVKAAVMPGAVGGIVIPGVGAIMRKDIAAKKVAAIKRGTVIEKRNPRTGEVSKGKHPGQKAYVKPARVKIRAIPLSALRRAANGTE